MFEARRVVRLEYEDGGVARVVYGSACDPEQDERSVEATLQFFRRSHPGLQVKRLCIVVAPIGCPCDNQILQELQVPENG